MKKFSLLFLLFAFLLGFASCVFTDEDQTIDGEGIQYLSIENRTGETIKFLYGYWHGVKVPCLQALPLAIDNGNSAELAFVTDNEYFVYYIEYQSKIYKVCRATTYPNHNSESVYIHLKDSKLYMHDNRENHDWMMKLKEE